MKKIKMTLIGGIIALAISSCSITAPVTASKAEIGKARGSSETVVLFGTLFLNKDYGIKEAAKNGNITSAIATVDEKITNYFFFTKKELIVTSK